MGEHYDSLFSTWRLAWIAHQLPRDPLHLFDANIFYPELDTLSYSDALLLPGFLGAPLMWMGLHPVVEHNLLVLISFVACGVSMYFLVQDRNAVECRPHGLPEQYLRFSHIGSPTILTSNCSGDGLFRWPSGR